MIKFCINFFLLATCFNAFAQVIEPPQPSNLLTSSVNVSVSQDSQTQLYTYHYKVTNNIGSQQSLTKFSIDISEDSQIVSVTSPRGWRYYVASNKKYLMWNATEILPEDRVENWDGNLVPSSFVIKPGQALEGFSVVTYSAPKTGNFYATGFVRIPVVTDASDLEEGGYKINSFPDNSFIGRAEVPSSIIYDGNRRPAVDGFLAFVNLNGKNNKFLDRATIYLKFSVNAEQVNKESLVVKLNGVDVTSAFTADSTKVGDLVGNFSLEDSILMQGKNILLTTVEGMIPDSSRTAVDTDRITFTVEKSPVTKAHINFDFDSGDGNNGKGKGSVK